MNKCAEQIQDNKTENLIRKKTYPQSCPLVDIKWFTILTLQMNKRSALFSCQLWWNGIQKHIGCDMAENVLQTQLLYQTRASEGLHHTSLSIYMVRKIWPPFCGQYFQMYIFKDEFWTLQWNLGKAQLTINQHQFRWRLDVVPLFCVIRPDTVIKNCRSISPNLAAFALRLSMWSYITSSCLVYISYNYSHIECTSYVGNYLYITTHVNPIPHTIVDQTGPYYPDAYGGHNYSKNVSQL